MIWTNNLVNTNTNFIGYVHPLHKVLFFRISGTCIMVCFSPYTKMIIVQGIRMY